MICHICGESAVGQCQSCWKFFCFKHGDRQCETCANSAASFSLPIVSQAIKRDGRDTPLSREIKERVRRMHMEGTELQRVIPIVQTEKWGDLDLTLSSLEVFEDGSILRYQTQGELIFRLPQLLLNDIISSRPSLNVEDDVGTEYYAFMGAGGGDESLWQGSVRITPAIPSAAGTLRIRVRPPRSLTPTESLPATFEVAL